MSLTFAIHSVQSGNGTLTFRLSNIPGIRAPVAAVAAIPADLANQTPAVPAVAAVAGSSGTAYLRLLLCNNNDQSMLSVDVPYVEGAIGSNYISMNKPIH